MTPSFAAVLSVAAYAQTASSISLNSFPNPANYGQAVTLTATVTAGATGKVTFYAGTTILGVGAVSAGSASISTILLPPGPSSLHAHYSGDGAYAPSDSAALTQSAVEGTSFGFKAAVNYAAGDSPYSLGVGDFNGDGKADLAVVGHYAQTVNIMLGNGDGSFQAPVSYSSGTDHGRDVVVADWNGDGVQDLGVGSSNNGSVTVLLGNGDGSFQSAVSACSNCSVTGIAAADFNGDGKADLVVSSGSGAAAYVLLGNGDGTFQAPVKYMTTVNSASAVAVGDLNGDGKADFAVAYLSSIYVFLGNGDGTFGTAITVPLAGPTSANGLALADVNGDGRLDAVFADDNYSGRIYTKLGNGDGTFQAYVRGSFTLQYPYAVAVADLNGDGKPDVVAQSYNDPLIYVFLGGGDGSLQGLAAYAAHTAASSVALGDFNGDGRVDAAAALYGQVAVLLGGAIPDLSVTLTRVTDLAQGQVGAKYQAVVPNSGTLDAAGVVTLAFSFPSGFVATAISGSGWACVLASVTCTRSNSLAPNTSYPPVTVTVNVSNTPGPATATATVSGGGDQNASNNTASDTTNVRSATTVTLNSSPNPSTLGQAVTLTATVGSGTGSVTFYDGTTMLGVASLSSGTATLTTSLLPSGSHALTALYDGDATYGLALSAVRTQTVNAAATNGVRQSTSYIAGMNVLQVVVGDVNNDNNADILTASASGISLLLGNADGTFQAATTPEPYLGGAGLAVSDVNGDGKLDLLFRGNYGDNALYLARGNGDGTFQASTVIGTLSPDFLQGGLAVGDFNRDGLSDVLTMNTSGIAFYAGNGDGTFKVAAATSLSSTISSAALTALVDMNGDGILDVVVSSASSSSLLYIYLGLGDGSFQSVPITHSSPASFPYLIVVADFNRDGSPDVVQLYPLGATTSLGNGDGTLQDPFTSPLNLFPGPAGISGDFNADGSLDIAYASDGPNEMTVLFGKGDGTFGPTTMLPIDGSGDGFALGDLNHDGRPDLVVANDNADTVNIFLGGQFSGLSVSSTHSGPFTAGSTGSYQITVTNPLYMGMWDRVIVADTLPPGLTATGIAGDNWNCTLATLTCNQEGGLQTAYSYYPITVAVNVSSGVSPSTVNNQASVTAAGVINYSLDPTLVVAPSTTSISASAGQAALGTNVTFTATVSGGASGSVIFLDSGNVLGSAALSGGTAMFATRLLPAGVRSVKAVYGGDSTHAPSASDAVSVTISAALASGFSTATPSATGTGPWAVVNGDFNGDGKTDLVTANATANTISVLLGNGDGSFQAKVDYNVGTQPVAAAVGDFNLDGKTDIAVANQGGKTLSVLTGKGDGTFNPPTSLSTGTDAPTSIAAVDWNQDGRLDLMVVSSGSEGGSGNVFAFDGNGDGTFTRSAPNLYSGADTALVADFNLDGKLDLLTLGYSSVYFFPGTGDGTRNSRDVYTSGPFGAVQMISGDINGDGILDVVAADSTGYADVFIGNGDGSFKSYVQYATGSNPVQVALGDINGDGKLDIVSANSASNTISVLLGNGDGTFQEQQTYAPGSGPSSVVLGDWNGDSRTDLAIANTNSNSITVYLGVLTPVLSASSMHIGNFRSGLTGTYTLTVTNLGPGVMASAVSLVDTLPSGLTAASMSGTGWNCDTGTLTCTRSDMLGVGASYDPVTLVVNVANNTTSPAVNTVNVMGGGAIGQFGLDSTIVNSGPPYPILTSPANQATGVSPNPTLSWNASVGADAYDVYLGTSNPPAWVTTVGTASYSASGLYPGQKYYWQIAAKNVGGSNPSEVWSFTTAATTEGPAVSVSPSIGSAGRQVFDFTARDASGYSDIQYMQFLFSKPGITAVNACYVSYDPAGNVFYLLSDDATEWYGLIGGSDKTTGNAQCTIYGATSGSTKSGTDVVAHIDISFRSGFAGSKNIYQFVGDTSGGTSGWTLMGRHDDSGDGSAVEVVSYSPASGSGAAQSFTTVVRDSDGANTIAFAQFVMNSSLNGYNGCFIHYDRASNVFFLLSDDGSQWYGLYAGSFAQVSNSQCTLNGPESGGAASGSDLTIRYSLEFSPAFAGAKVTYMQVADNGGVIEVWHQVGTWTR